MSPSVSDSCGCCESCYLDGLESGKDSALTRFARHEPSMMRFQVVRELRTENAALKDYNRMAMRTAQGLLDERDAIIAELREQLETAG